MKNRDLFFIFIWCFILGCQSNHPTKTPLNKDNSNQQKVRHSIETSIHSKNKKSLQEWKEYDELEVFLDRFKNISSAEALNNAVRLSEIIKELKDSIRPKSLQNDAFRTRINVLENEALRLKDMSYIQAITDKEVNSQVSKILAAFSATNSKINTELQRKRSEESLDFATEMISTTQREMESPFKKTSSRTKLSTEKKNRSLLKMDNQ